LKKLKILFLVNIPSPYRVDFFNELGKLSNLTVLYERKLSKTRSLDWHKYNHDNYRAIFLPGIAVKANTALSLKVMKYLNNYDYDLIIVGGYATPTGVLSILYMRLKKIKFVLSVDGGFINYNEKWYKRKLKKFLISKAYAWLSTGKLTNVYLEYYGANIERTYIYPFTTIYRDEMLKKVTNFDEKNAIKMEKGLKSNLMILSIGQFIYRKGFDILLKTFARVKSNCHLYIIGGKPTDEYLKIIKDYNIENITFIDFLSKEEIAKYYKAADLFVLLTREDIWGLVINEAISYGLPIISSNKSIAAMELIDNGINGYIVDLDNEQLIANKIDEILLDSNLRFNMSLNSLNKAKMYTIENSAYQTYLSINKIYKDLES
jgi:glycosyltransferase involved in cell wall biosynthesis